jgi:transcriptional regulator with XRE-family HTH domain
VVELDAERVRALARARGLDMTGLARSAGLSRQGLHRLLRQKAGILSRGIESLAEALEVDALALLRSPSREATGWERLRPLVESAAGGSARAFEELPARFDLPAVPRDVPPVLAPHAHQVLAAAAEVAHVLWPRRWQPGFAARQAERVPAGQLFAFGLGMMSLERLEAETPAPMRRQRVLGAFALEDFARHGPRPAGRERR